MIHFDFRQMFQARPRLAGALVVEPNAISSPKTTGPIGLTSAVGPLAK